MINIFVACLRVFCTCWFNELVKKKSHTRTHRGSARVTESIDSRYKSLFISPIYSTAKGVFRLNDCRTETFLCNFCRQNCKRWCKESVDYTGSCLQQIRLQRAHTYNEQFLLHHFTRCKWDSVYLFQTSPCRIRNLLMWTDPKRYTPQRTGCVDFVFRDRSS